MKAVSKSGGRAPPSKVDLVGMVLDLAATRSGEARGRRRAIREVVGVVGDVKRIVADEAGCIDSERALEAG